MACCHKRQHKHTTTGAKLPSTGEYPPVDKTKMMGVRLDVSGKTSPSVHGGGSVKCVPSSKETYSWQPISSFSSLNTRSSRSL